MLKIMKMRGQVFLKTLKTLSKNIITVILKHIILMMTTMKM